MTVKGVGMHAEIAAIVPVTGGQFAPELITLDGQGGAVGGDRAVNEASVLIDTLITDAVVVVEIRAIASQDWIVAREYNSAGLQEILQFAGVRFVRLRVRSGGTAGTQRVVVYWR